MLAKTANGNATQPSADNSAKQESDTRGVAVPTPVDRKPWKRLEIRNLWKDRYNTDRTRCQEALTDSIFVKDLMWFINEQNELEESEALSLFQHWVESILQFVYHSAFEEAVGHKLYLEVLYVTLNTRFLPGEQDPQQFALSAHSTEDKASVFLRALELTVARNKRGCVLQSLGWLVKPRRRPGLVLCWDELIPQARYLPYWKQSSEAEIFLREGTTLYLRVYPDGDEAPHDVAYTIQGFEADGLEAGDIVRYWQELEGTGKPFVFPEAPLSPYADQRMAEWNDVDEDVYTSDPLPVG